VVFGVRDFKVYEPLMHKHNETRSVELQNVKGLWAQHFEVSEFRISRVCKSGFHDSGCNVSRPFELPGPEIPKRGLMGLGLFTFRGFMIPDATFLGPSNSWDPKCQEGA